jgi:crotonobetainyl-CoA:carnitine CoA-transferase CaiB-like acyl-CoA transferase
VTRTKAEVASEGRRRGINATVVCEPADVLADGQLRGRNFWHRTDGVDLPGRFVSFTSGAEAADGAHAADGVRTAASAATATPAAATAEPATTRTGPLTGVKILDFSWALVGSISTKTLGDLGADVVKVESRGRPCLSRMDVQVSVSKAGNFDDKPWFAHLNSSKRSLALDMKKPESRELIEPLIRWADVVVENFSPGTMHKLGLDYDSLRKLNPSLVMVSGSVYGQTGPMAQEWGVDGTGAALSGRTYLTGWPDRDPVIPGAVPYGDVIVPYVMAAAVSAALQQRRASGRGTHIDASMYEICVQQTYAAIEQAQRGTRPDRQGNADAAIFHQGVYPVAGADRWLAITCHTAADWQLLRATAGLPETAGPAETDAAERDRLIGAWTAGQSGAELMQRLQAAGIAAGVVQDIEDLAGDPQLAERGALITLDHPLLGAFGHVNTPVRFSRSVLAPFRPPHIGEHSHAIAASLAALSDARIAELEQLGVFQ